MICRDVLESKSLDAYGGFDYFNDYHDTHNYLMCEAQHNEDPIVRNDAAELAELLTARYHEYLYVHGPGYRHHGRLS